MHSGVRWAFAFATSALFALPASAEPPTSAPKMPAASVAPQCVDGSANASVAEEREFEVATERYLRLTELTQRIVREREQREFEAAAERYLRFAELTQRLAEQAERELEQSFQAEVELYLKKRELTRDLAEQNTTASKAAAPPALSPSPAPRF